MLKVITPKQVKIIARYEIHRNGHVVYQVRSTSGQDIYNVTLVNDKATGCSCPAYKPCYHMTQLEAREAARRDQKRAAYDASFDPCMVA